MGGGNALWEGLLFFLDLADMPVANQPVLCRIFCGIYLATIGKKANPEIRRWMIIPCIAYGVGFSTFYSLLIASGLDSAGP